MTETKSGGPSKCPKCGSTDLAIAISKPPTYICKKCGHQFT